jgi:hypothetical protein
MEGAYEITGALQVPVKFLGALQGSISGNGEDGIQGWPPFIVLGNSLVIVLHQLTGSELL